MEIGRMRSIHVTVRFAHGLHARTAAGAVRVLRKFRSRVLLRAGNRVANASSILSLLLLAATCNTQIEVQASGEDEDAAVRAAEAFFQNDDERALGALDDDKRPGGGLRDQRAAG
jgi:phosphocarrier protein HPr